MAIEVIKLDNNFINF